MRHAFRVHFAVPFVFFTLSLALVASPSAAIQLHWAGGATDLAVTQTTRAMLVVQPDSAEAGLPPSWRLQWVADSSGVQFAALDPTAACLVDTAKISSLVPPSTAADSASHMTTATFCSTGGAATAVYLVDLVAGSQGKMRVIALDPADSTRMVQSNEVTFNGGLDGSYAPAILGTTYAHADGQLFVRAVGSGLGTVLSTELEATNGTWTFPLAVTENTDTSLTSTATTAAAMPECLLSASLDGGPTLEAPVAAEAVSLPSVPLFNVEMFDPNDDFYPKDFAFVYTPGKFHIIYIRHNAWERRHGGSIVPDSLNERAFGHRWTSDWVNWDHDPSPADTTALSSLDGTWDDTHVWAPTIVQQGLEFYMFYTGVRDSAGLRVQRMGLARSFDLSHWTRNGTPVNIQRDVFWADHSPTSTLEFRDPFVMPDPTRPTGWLMYYVATIGNRVPQMAVGVARSKADTLGGGWTNLALPLLVSDDAHTFGGGKAESPHVFWDRGNWQLFFTTGSGHPISLAMNSGAPIDTLPSDSTHWTLNRLYYELVSGGEDPLNAAIVDHWSGTEYLSVYGRDFMGAYDGAGIRIQEMTWQGTTPDYFTLNDPAAAAERDGSAPSGPVLTYAGANPLRGGARLAVGARRGENARVGLYDVTGRRVRVLWDGAMPSGRITVDWDGRDAGGRQVRSGIYFAQLSCRGATRSLRVPLIW